MFQFLWPWMFLLLPLPWLMRLLLPSAPPATGGALYLPFAPDLTGMADNRLPQGQKHRLRWWLALFCWALLLTAAARPQWQGEPIELPETGRNLILAVDVSGSMEKPDMADGRKNRLQVVKEVVGEFIRRRQGDRLGLILFGTHAYLQAPLTFDTTTVAKLLYESNIGIAGKNTAIGDAVGLGIKRLREAKGEAVMVLLTDGANTAGHVAPKKAAELAQQEGLKIYTIGVAGTPGMLSSMFGLQTQSRGDLDEATLKYLAETTGGRYYRATDRAQLEQIYHQLDHLEPITRKGHTVRPIQELYDRPLALALMVSMAMAMLTLIGHRGSRQP